MLGATCKTKCWSNLITLWVNGDEKWNNFSNHIGTLALQPVGLQIVVHLRVMLQFLCTFVWIIFRVIYNSIEE